MNELEIRNHIQRHADAVLEGAADIVTADIADELLPTLPELASSLPQPLTAVEVLSVDVGDPLTVAFIRYSGEESHVTFRSHWQERGGPHPVVVRAELVNGPDDPPVSR